jgi:putative holliday junction resolvase
VRPGIRLGVDVGKARIGIARCDPSGLLATPVETVRRERGDALADVQRIAALAEEWETVELVVGLPLGLSGSETASTGDARMFAERLAAAQPRPVRLVDERLSTVSAQSALHGAGRKTKESRAVIDQAAAVVILQHALDWERAQGSPPGTLASGG